MLRQLQSIHGHQSVMDPEHCFAHVPLITVNTVCLQQMNSCNTFMAQSSTAACKGTASSKAQAEKCTGSFENTTTAGTVDAALSAARAFHTDKLLPTSPQHAQGWSKSDPRRRDAFYLSTSSDWQLMLSTSGKRCSKGPRRGQCLQTG